MKLYHCGITIDVSAADAQRYLNAGYVPVVEVTEPVEMPAPAQPAEAVELPKARKSAKRKG
jgi:hypothetical protein